jgi:homoserine kinase type II
MEGQLEQVLQHYPLGQLTSVCRIEQGFVNDHWRLITAKGRFFLKRLNPLLRQSHLVHTQHRLVRHLRRSDFPAPRIVPTHTGHTLLILDSEWYEIQDYIEGDSYNHDRPAHLQEAAITLGRYHACVESFAPQALRGLGDLFTPPVIRSNLNNLIDARALDQEHKSVELAGQLSTEISHLAVRFAAHETLRQLVTHGDYYGGNLIFDGDRIVGVVDYDKARWQPQIAEVAEALIYFASPRSSHMKHIVYPGFLEWEPLSRFLESYSQSRTLEEREIDALPDFVEAVWLSMSLLRLWERGLDPAHSNEALEEVLLLSEWIKANASRMVEVCHAVVIE